MPLEDFIIQDELGRGAFGTVFRVVRKQDSKVYALKRVRVDSLSEKDCAGALNEIRILASVSGPGVIEYKEAFFDAPNKELCVVMELADGGDLLNLVRKNQNELTMVTQKEIWKVAYEMLEGLMTLHSANIIHRDIKSANVFFCNGVAKLGDLNISKLAKNKMSSTQVGTPYYCPPEMWADGSYSQKVDIWSLGCVIYQMAALKPPFRANSIEGLYLKIKEGSYDKLPFLYSKGLSMFIGRCLVVNPAKRASVKQLLDSPFFREFRKLGSLEVNTAWQSQINELMMKTIQLPTNLEELNQKLPTPQYERKGTKKMKTVFFEENKLAEDSSNKCGGGTVLLPSLKSQKHLPPLQRQCKPEHGLRKVDSNKVLRIHKVAKSMKLIGEA